MGKREGIMMGDYIYMGQYYHNSKVDQDKIKILMLNSRATIKYDTRRHR